MSYDPIVKRPSETFQARQTQNASTNAPHYQNEKLATTAPTKSSPAIPILLFLIFLSNVLIIVVLALLLAKGWASWNLLNSVINGDAGVNVDVDRVNQVVVVTPQN
jgi:hypothetical protein